MTETGGPGDAGGTTVSVTVYRLRKTLSSRMSDLLTLALVVGLLGGIAMASVQAGRATQSAYSAFLAKTNPSDLTMSTYGNGVVASANNYSPTLASEIARLPDVKKVESWVGLGVIPLSANGAPDAAFLTGTQFNIVGSKGIYFDEDRATAVEGRLPNPNRIDEFTTTVSGARLLHLRVGQVIPVGLFTAQQFQSPLFGTPKLPPALRINMKLVGTVVFNDQVIIDDTDKYLANLVFTPALTRMVADIDTQGTWYALQLAHGDRDVPKVEQAMVALLPKGSVGNFSVTAVAKAKVERSTRPEAIALGVFGLIAALAALGLALPIIARHLRSLETEQQVLRALGATPVTTVADGLAGILAAAAVGAVLAEALALALSPLNPLGPVRSVYHPAGLHADGTVLGLGALLFLGGPVATAMLAAYLRSPGRLARQADLVKTRYSSVARAASASGLPAPGAIGLRFALEPGSGRSTVPTRSVLAGAVAAVLLVTATLTFSSGLHTLISEPPLYGWNWNYTLFGEMGVPPQAQNALTSDPDVAAWSGYQDLGVQINGVTVPTLIEVKPGPVGPPTLSGHGVRGSNQVVLGAATLAQLHVRVGQTVTFSLGTPNTAPLYISPRPARVVGTATFPSIAGSSTLTDHTSMGTGAIVSKEIVTSSIAGFASGPDPTTNGPSLVFVRMKPHIGSHAAGADIQRIAQVADKAFAADPNAFGASVTALGVQRPAEIVNYQSTGNTPLILAGGLAVGAVLSLGLNLVASVRRRNRDLALLKTLGFTRRQLAATVTWQATIVVAIALAVGVPLGIAAGRQLWVLFARNIDAVPRPTVPLSILAVVLGGLLLANFVAAVPRRLAARTPVGLVLRAE